MNAPLSHRPGLILCGLVALLFAATASAQEPLTKAKALYDAAAYEEALTLLAPEHVPEAQQYKALCMLALGRSQDATGAVETLVAASPTFEPSAEDVPPRFVTLVTEAKRKLLPGIARRTFTEGRDQFKSGDHAEALKKFDLVLTLMSSPAFKETPDAEDLRTLASGFIELARASAPKPEPKAVPTPAPEPPKVAEVPAGPPPDVVQPVAIRQSIPPVPTGMNGAGSPTASVRVQIGPDGKVVAAVMQQASHPLYDRALLLAAREWLYTPATLNGRPVPSEKVVTVQLR
jgi:tetratricopeptide (TPR) repeat protein